MSLWDKYLAPGDVRRQRQLDAVVPPPTTQRDDPTQPPAKPPILPRIDTARRARRQNALLYGGLGFTFLSLFITRRALRRKHIQTYPKTFTPSNSPPQQVDGGLEALEALSLATLSVFSIAMASAGGLMKYFDIADVEDLREQVRKAGGYDVYGGDSEADKEIEGWIAEVLSRKDVQGGLREGIAERLVGLEKRDAERKERERSR